MPLLRIIIFVTLTLAVIDALGDTLPVYVYQRPNINVRFLPGPCVNPEVVKMVAAVVPHLIMSFHPATAMVNKRTRIGCWIEYVNSGIVVLVLADGSMFKVPRDMLVRPAAA